MTQPFTTLTVALGERSYPIHIGAGLLDRPELLSPHISGKQVLVVSNETVAPLYLQRMLASLGDYQCETVILPDGEQYKTLDTLNSIFDALLKARFDRSCTLLALGGGVVGDITGFAAATYQRGVHFIQVPTTLLAQVDSSVGGKTGVDIPEGKNLVGAFYQPRAVFIDSQVLLQLPPDELLNGLAEVIKYGVIYDRDFFKFLEMSRKDILALDLQILEDVIARCCKIKTAVVEADEQEFDLRRILNFGHTIGHAVEAVSGYRQAHGAAVAMGMVAAAEIAVLKGILDQREKERLENLIRAFGLPVTIPPDYDRGRIQEYLLSDKKTIGGKVVFVLPVAIGKVIITDEIEAELVAKGL